MMSSLNQSNKAAVWDFWQKLNHVPNDQIADVIRAACHDDVDWNGSAPIDRLVGIDALIADLWEPLLRSFPDLKRTPDIFMGGSRTASRAMRATMIHSGRLRTARSLRRERLMRLLSPASSQTPKRLSYQTSSWF